MPYQFSMKKNLLLIFLVSCILFPIEANPTIVNDSIVETVKQQIYKGVRYRNKGLFSKALNEHYASLDRAQQLNDTSLMIYALNNIGVDLRRTGSHHEASNYHYTAIQLSESFAPNTKSHAIAYNGLGNSYLSLYQYDKALKMFQEALKIEQFNANTLGCAIDYCNIADVYKGREQIDSALHYYAISLQENRKIQSKIGVSICKKSIGLILIDEAHTQTQGLRYLQESIDTLAGSRDLYHNVMMKTAMAEAYYKVGKYSKAEKQLQAVNQDVVRLGSLESSFTYYELLAKVYQKQSQASQAYRALEQSILYKDSMQLISNNVRILDMQQQYKDIKAKAQLKALASQSEYIKRAQSLQFWLFVVALLFVLALLIFAILTSRHRARLNRELKTVNRIKTRFFNNVSHELRTPVTLIASTLDNVDTSLCQEETQTYIHLAQKNANRLRFLVDQLLTLSKLSIKGFELRIAPLDISFQLKELVLSYQPYAEANNIVLESHVEYTGQVYGDHYLLDIMLSNLVHNALKYSKEQDQVKVQSYLHENHYYVRISNPYHGSDVTQLERLFERYYVSETHTKNSIGIGLSLVKEVLDLYQGKVDIKYHKDTNRIEFLLKLPIEKTAFTPESFVKPGKEAIVKDVEPVEENLLKEDAPILLIVEDTEDMSTFLKVLFQDTYKVITAKDGKEGLLLAQEEIPDIIISDVMMPHMDGHEFCRTLRQHINTNHIPILLLTALANEESHYAALEVHADAYMTKPFDSKLLKKKVASLLHVRSLVYNRSEETQSSEKILEDPFLMKLEEIKQETLWNVDFSVEQFAEEMYMSSAQFYRKMKAVTGYAPKEYILNQRMEMACKLLKETRLNVGEIAYKCGFSSPSYFSKTFKRFTSLAPLQYRNQA